MNGSAPLGDLLDAILSAIGPAKPPQFSDPIATKLAIVQGRAASAAQWLVVAALLATTGYALYAPTFVGEYSEFFAIFMWAFSANIGVDVLLEQSKQVSKPRQLGAVHE